MIPRIISLLQREIDGVEAVVLGGSCDEKAYIRHIAELRAYRHAIEIVKNVEQSSFDGDEDS